MSRRLDSVTLPPDVRTALDTAKSIVIPSSRAELYQLALGPECGPRFSL